ncbi:SDR family oxidoreductase [Desulfoprunum benzoelyticum]|uniref:Oxidoreductase n=1 Tax=Desulfoprunum benzoelyticum TaxID=1506996 RepID=A0A840UVT4_9BACT|nr:SDR family oxidoreductase [Desulfoprunum benzoelyticum]MBB5348946.1 hypothetical protein [Desulfoprunum benzoelyticum]MBM9530802.1 SDR family oxidoreductase [Desulfoprunum benzoelyticum]
MTLNKHRQQPTSQLIAVVTGGGQGIGRGIAARLVSDGMHVVIFDKDREAIEEIGTEFASAVTPLAGDVSKESEVSDLMQTVSTAFGRLDILVNNAGIATPNAPAIETLTLDQWDQVIAANLTGTFLCCKHAVPLLRKVRGTIVNIASTRALQSEANTEAYSASKGGIVALTHALAVSLGPEIRVNCISPGWIAVDNWQKRSRWAKPLLTVQDHTQHPVGRVGTPEDIAALVSFLVSTGAGFITGQNYIVDGGMTRKMIYGE